jgi:acetylornithine deacetylase/succinyl-diaminopimelate desuccinylase-like protein
VRAAFETACIGLGLRSIELVSGAGHDTQAMSAVCPAGMIFIPSSGGSHNPGEFADDEACENGANVLLQAAIAGWGSGNNW